MTSSKIPPAERFWQKIDKAPGHGPKGDCWIWTASQKRAGYGSFAFTGNGKIRNRGAHIYSYEMHYGAIPKGLFVLHRCDNPPCVRPDHLFLGTPKDNGVDMAQKGRATSPFTVDDVRAIRARYDAGGISFSQLASVYGVHKVTIRYIVRRLRWAHVD